jgi:hypothetical protein
MNEQTPPPQYQLPRQPQLPRLRLDFYSSAVLMSRWEEDGRVTTYPVSIHDVVSACTSVELSSGLLPANTLFWKQRANQAVLGVYVPARRWQVQCETANSSDNQSYYLPMPPFVFAGSGTPTRYSRLRNGRKLGLTTVKGCSSIMHPAPTSTATAASARGTPPSPFVYPKPFTRPCDCSWKAVSSTVT